MSKISIHAQKRMRQRGKKTTFVENILAYADMDIPAGDNCRLLRISKKLATFLNFDDRLSRYGLLWSDDNNQVVSILPIRESGSGARYRRVGS